MQTPTAPATPEIDWKELERKLDQILMNWPA
jgi:hypothetical protein